MPPVGFEPTVSAGSGRRLTPWTTARPLGPHNSIAIMWYLIKHRDNFVLFSVMGEYNFLFKVIIVVN